jgi:hypothetical protein
MNRYACRSHKIGIRNYYGFEIDGNGRFLLGDFTVTHNTSLCTTLTKRFAKQDIGCLWFSIELPYPEFLGLFGANMPLFYLPRTKTERTVKWIESKIKEAVEKYQIKVVFVDHLGLVVSEEDFKYKNAIDIIDQRIAQLRDLALKYRVCLIGVAEYNKERLKKAERSEMRTGDLRGTARLGYTASTIIGIERLVGVKNARVWQEIKNQPEEIFIKTDMWVYVLDSRRTGARKIKIRCYMNEEKEICEYDV